MKFRGICGIHIFSSTPKFNCTANINLRRAGGALLIANGYHELSIHIITEVFYVSMVLLISSAAGCLGFK